MDDAEEIAGGFIVAAGNAAILLEFVKELLYRVTGLVQMLVILSRLLAAVPGAIKTAACAFCKGPMVRYHAS
jgi:hypothetical protein